VIDTSHEERNTFLPQHLGRLHELVTFLLLFFDILHAGNPLDNRRGVFRITVAENAETGRTQACMWNTFPLSINSFRDNSATAKEHGRY
jgi:hypothetical protein